MRFRMNHIDLDPAIMIANTIMQMYVQRSQGKMQAWITQFLCVPMNQDHFSLNLGVWSACIISQPFGADFVCDSVYFLYKMNFAQLRCCCCCGRSLKQCVRVWVGCGMWECRCGHYVIDSRHSLPIWLLLWICVGRSFAQLDKSSNHSLCPTDWRFVMRPAATTTQHTHTLIHIAAHMRPLCKRESARRRVIQKSFSATWRKC